MKYYWLKLNENFFRDKRIKKLRKEEDGDALVLIYLKIQLASLKTGGRIEFENVEETLAEELALEIDEDETLVARVVGFLEKQGLLIETEEEGQYELPSVTSNTVSKDSATLRVEKYREKKKKETEAQEQPLQSNEHPLHCNDDVTDGCEKRNVEIEIERRDRDKDRKKEKSKKENRPSRFTVPTVDEVRAYCVSRKNQVDPEAFVDFYESKGWTIGQNKMKDWKAAVRTWEKRDIFSGSSKKEVNTGLPDWYDYKPNTPPSPEQLEKVLARQRELVEAREKKEKEKEAEKRSESDPLWPF
ncbi:phage replisome organizer N-terminal domain-containing protein [uncultured Dubosiella sp.]|uniref:phage replisome organizer N-terminal domain-containing protein n=1 Tax=uncultured Dubosiella sp. TaxID=1937011 RepID=UPI0025B53651|nr:phage replisome organizer N-terminal domain-containing protein [uncultured Dubosiella sp.]